MSVSSDSEMEDNMKVLKTEDSESNGENSECESSEEMEDNNTILKTEDAESNGENSECESSEEMEDNNTILKTEDAESNGENSECESSEDADSGESEKMKKEENANSDVESSAAESSVAENSKECKITANGKKEVVQYDIDVEVVQKINEANNFNQYNEMAKHLLEKYSDVKLVSRMLSLMNTKVNSIVKSRPVHEGIGSKLTGRKGFTAYMFSTKIENLTKSFMYKILKKMIDDEVVDQIEKIRMSSDRLKFVFELPSDQDETFMSNWTDSSQNKLQLLDGTIPELLEVYEVIHDNKMANKSAIKIKKSQDVHSGSGSKLTGRENYTAFILTANRECISKGYVYKALKRLIEEEVVEKIEFLQMATDKMNFVFDLPSEDAEAFNAKWKDGKYDKVQLLEGTIPELLDGPVRSHQSQNLTVAVRGRGRGGIGRGGSERGRGGFGRGGFERGRGGFGRGGSDRGRGGFGRGGSERGGFRGRGGDRGRGAMRGGTKRPADDSDNSARKIRKIL